MRTGEPASPGGHAGPGAKRMRPWGAGQTMPCRHALREVPSQVLERQAAVPGAAPGLQAEPLPFRAPGLTAERGQGPSSSQACSRLLRLPEGLRILSGREGKLAKLPAMTLLLKSGFDKWRGRLAVRGASLGRPPRPPGSLSPRGPQANRQSATPASDAGAPDSAAKPCSLPTMADTGAAFELSHNPCLQKCSEPEDRNGDPEQI